MGFSAGAEVLLKGRQEAGPLALRTSGGRIRREHFVVFIVEDEGNLKPVSNF
jgi:hypothetical protein